MLANLFLGTLLICATVMMHTIGLITLSRLTPRYVRWFRLHRHVAGQSIALTGTVLGIFLLHTLEVWVWAIAYVLTHAIEEFEAALYFSTVTFSTVGFGDVRPSLAWRQFASLEAIDGFILIGWSIAYLVAASTRHGPFRQGEHF
jgi:hypothetical protein